MNLREFLIKDCCDNKQIQSCQECRYEQECDQIHIKLIIKAINQWITAQQLEAINQAKISPNWSPEYINGLNMTHCYGKILEEIKPLLVVTEVIGEEKK
jgi:hypothetical protein